MVGVAGRDKVLFVREEVRTLVKRPRRESAREIRFDEVIPMRNSLTTLNDFLIGSFAKKRRGELSDFANHHIENLKSDLAKYDLGATLVQWIHEQEKSGLTVADAIKALTTNLPQEVTT